MNTSQSMNSATKTTTTKEVNCSFETFLQTKTSLLKRQTGRMVKRTRLSWDEAYSICLEYLWHSYNKWYTRKELDKNYTKWITWLIIREHRERYWYRGDRQPKPIIFSFSDEDADKFVTKEPEWTILEHWPKVEEAIERLPPDLKDVILYKMSDEGKAKRARTRKERRLEDLAIWTLKGEVKV